ncbi:hypothetical protein PMG11_06875 [Penicillium brasilianum]|uniref:Uncharacterized protein n=1 Tax=Penicillium brasilianum TaxID=104259 RepID=A0A0F7TNB5_PENBI|nr:hypothetical protein PMG11_06875 [Penicillium brasilianum]
MFRHGQTQAPSGFQAHGTPIPWAEIFSRHEAVLASHLEMLDSVKSQIAPDGEAFRTLSSMVTKTIQAMNQSKVARKQMLNRNAPENPFNNPHSSSSASKMNERPTATPQSTETETSCRKKRCRTEKAEVDMQNQVQSLEEDPRASKRRRDLIGEDARSAHYASSGSQETEDISAEVQRRLKIKEEKRRMREKTKPEKRKRESLVSNDGASPAEANHRKKRARRTSSDLKRNGEPLVEKEADEKTRRFKRARNGG